MTLRSLPFPLQIIVFTINQLSLRNDKVDRNQLFFNKEKEASHINHLIKNKRKTRENY